MYIICREGIQALCDINEEEAVVKLCKGQILAVR